MSKATQIGWYNLKEDKVFRNTYECAAWYEDVIVKAGRYPVVVYNFHTLDHKDPKWNGMVKGSVDGAYADMDGIIESDYFAGQYFGVPISDYDSSKNAGKPSSYRMFAYLHQIADSIINDADSPWELLDEFEARVIRGEWNGESYKTHSIYKR